MHYVAKRVEKELRRSGIRVDAEWKMNADGFLSLFCNTDHEWRLSGEMQNMSGI